MCMCVCMHCYELYFYASKYHDLMGKMKPFYYYNSFSLAESGLNQFRTCFYRPPPDNIYVHVSVGLFVFLAKYLMNHYINETGRQ